jgi:cytoskeletal protein RodZ
MIFEVKKISLETLSEYLAEVRGQLHLSAAEVCEQTGIQPKFLEMLEQNRFHQLPADVYVFGFLRQLAILYAVDSTVLINQYKKECGIQRQLQARPLFEMSKTKKILGKFVITPKVLSIWAGLLFVVVTLGYIAWQVGSINKTPSLVIISPQDRQIISDSVISVSGRTDPGTAVSINNKSVFVDADGDFTEQIGIDNGPQQLVFTAANKFNKTAEKSLTVIGQDNSVVLASSSPVTAAPTIQGVQLKLEFSGRVTLVFSVDNAAPQTIVFNAGDIKALSGQDKITISTSNAGATAAIYNGQNLGLLGKPGEKLANVPFFPQSGTINATP